MSRAASLIAARGERGGGRRGGTRENMHSDTHSLFLGPFLVDAFRYWTFDESLECSTGIIARVVQDVQSIDGSVVS